MSQSEGLDLAVATTELASELSAIRQRGIGGIDRQRSRDGKQQPLVLPVFERLLEQFPAQAGVSRQANIEALLRAELDAYEQAAPSNDAAFIRRLLFLPDGSVPLGPGSQSDLLSAARITVGLKGKVDAFRAVQNERFDQFAAFLLRDAEWATQSTVPNSEQIAELDAPVDSHRCSAVVDVPAPPSVATEQGRSNHPTDETATTSNQPKSRWRTWLIVVVVVAVIASAAVLASAHFRSHSSAHPGAPSSPTASKPATHQFRFDSLGSTASSILNVYPGVGQNAHDKQANGTFHSGDVVTAVCVTTGRRITSDPSYGETLRSSTEWVRIAAVAGVTQYASVTYGGYVGNPPPSC